MSSEAAITVRGLGKSYRIEHKVKHSTAAETLMHRMLNPLRKPEVEEMWALRDVSFDINRGDIVGLLGRNGAGKSTLLKLLSRIAEPTTGEARIAGRVASLIEVGTGFQPELTGRENIYLNGAILGMRRREITRRFDEIVDFSGVEKFLDTPVKRYSSGMYVRLAFSVAAHLDADILLVDEVLSVGDAEFQKKSLGKMDDVANSGRTVLFVSHSLTAVESLCKTGIVFDRGRLVQSGGIRDTLEYYHRTARENVLAAAGDLGPVSLKGAKHLEYLDLIDEFGESTRQMPIGGTLRVRIGAQFADKITYPTFSVFIDNALGQRALTLKSPKTSNALDTAIGENTFECVVETLPFAPGEYTIRLALDRGGERLDDTGPVLTFVVRDADAFTDGWGALRGFSVAKSRWNAVVKKCDAPLKVP